MLPISQFTQINLRLARDESRLHRNYNYGGLTSRLGAATLAALTCLPALPAASAGSDTLSVTTFTGINLVRTITEDDEVGGRGSIGFSIPAASIDYFDSDGSVSDILSYSQFTVALFSDLEETGRLQEPQPSIGRNVVPQRANILEAYRLQFFFISSIREDETRGDVPSILETINGMTTNLASINLVFEDSIINTLAFPQTVVEFFEPGTQVLSDRLFISPITFTFISDSPNGPPLTPTGDFSLIESQNEPAILTITAMSDVPEPSTSSLLAIGIVLLGFWLFRARLKTVKLGLKGLTTALCGQTTGLGGF
jgi:PEP-CTERM motif-containing protein